MPASGARSRTPEAVLTPSGRVQHAEGEASSRSVRDLLRDAVLRQERARGKERKADPAAWANLLATFTAFTARSIGDAYRRWVIPRGVDEVILTGGGARNPALVKAIRAELGGIAVEGEAALGMSPDAREAAAFAVLAWAHLLGAPANVPEATGAEGPRVLGSLTPGRSA